jgi:hypothetical protein
LKNFFNKCIHPNLYVSIHTNLLMHLDKIDEVINTIMADKVISNLIVGYDNRLVEVIWNYLLPSIEIGPRPEVKSTQLTPLKYIKIIERHIKIKKKRALKVGGNLGSDQLNNIVLDSEDSALLNLSDDNLRNIGQYLSCWYILLLRLTCKRLNEVFANFQGKASSHPLMAKQFISSILPQ